MAIDRKVYQAVYSAVANHDQPDKVAQRMIKWLEELSDGIASLSNSDDIKFSIETILEAIEINEDEELE